MTGGCEGLGLVDRFGLVDRVGLELDADIAEQCNCLVTNCLKLSFLELLTELDSSPGM